MLKLSTCTSTLTLLFVPIVFSYCILREVVASLIEEYKACDSADYINWGMGGGSAAAAGAGASQQTPKEPATAT